MPRNPAPKPKKPGPKPKPDPAEEQPPPPDVDDVKRAREDARDGRGTSIDEILEESPAPPVQVIERRIEMVTVEIPLGEPPHRFDQIHLEVLLLGEHAHTFARLRQALRDQDARTADGREVRSGPDILRWLLEQFGPC